MQGGKQGEGAMTLEGLRKPIGISTYTDNLIQKVEHHLEVLTDELSKTIE